MDRAPNVTPPTASPRHAANAFERGRTPNRQSIEGPRSLAITGNAAQRSAVPAVTCDPARPTALCPHSS